MAGMNARTRLDFWFDPSCPWAWLTSRWIREVERVRRVDVTWRPMSLAILNQDKDIPAEYRAFLPQLWGPARVATAAYVQHGPDAAGSVYDALGARLHPQPEGEVDRDALFRDAVAAAGLPPSVASAASVEDFDDALRDSHGEGMALVGDDVGTPVLRVVPGDGESFAFFGPIVSPAPRGDDAGRLWDAFLAVGSVPGVWEIKRTRTAPPALV